MMKLSSMFSCVINSIGNAFASRRIENIGKATAKSTTDENYERCVMCGELTDVPLSMPIESRENYEVGCGQLCHVCKAALDADSK